MDFAQNGKILHLNPETIRAVYDVIKEAKGRKYVSGYTSREFTREPYIAVCDARSDYLATCAEIEYSILKNNNKKGKKQRCFFLFFVFILKNVKHT